MKGKYKRRKQSISLNKQESKNKTLLVLNQTLLSGEDIAEEKPVLPTPKERKEPSWFVSILASLTIIFLSFSFMTMLDPVLTQSENKAFMASLEKETQKLMEVPAGRFVTYKNAWGIPTLRIITISDYSYNQAEGRCVSFKYIFSDAQRKECFPSTKKDFEGINTLVGEE